MTDILGPNDEAGAYASEQGAGYRRGFVMGLTLAEVALLLIFILLLLLVLGFEKRDAEIRRLASAAALIRSEAAADESPQETISRITEELSKFGELKAAAESSGAEISDDFIELVKLTAAQVDSTEVALAEQLAKERERVARAAELLESVQGGGDIEAMASRLAELEDRERNQAGQVLELRERLNRVGRGGDLPSCWTTPEGKADFILEVVLESGGVRVSDAISNDRAEERSRLPISEFDPSVTFSEARFLELTRPLFDWSVRNECRFYVDVFDATADHEKGLYKSRLRAVEGHFYKRHLEGRRAPF